MAPSTVRTVLADLVFGEGPRWHDGRLWFSDMHDHRVIATTIDGDATTIVEVRDDEPSGLGWLPDGRLLADPIGARVFRVKEGGEVTDSLAFADVIPVACVLGGDDRRTLLMCVAADWKRDAIAGRRTGRIDACEVDVPGAGRP